MRVAEEATSEPAAARIFVRRPLVGLAFGMAVGTTAGLCTDVSGRCLLLASVGAWLLAVVLAGVARWRARSGVVRPSVAPCGFALLIAIISLAWAAAALRRPVVVAPEGGTLGDAMGVVTAEPEALAMTTGAVTPWRVPFLVEQWRVGSNAWQAVNAPSVVRWYIPARLARKHTPHCGETWTLSNIRWRAHAEREDGNRRRWPPQLRVYGRQAVLASNPNRFPVQAWCYTARRRAAAQLALGVERFTEEVGFMQALLLGYRGRLAPEVRQDFLTTGTLHIIAVSGSHVVVIVGVVIFVLRGIGISRERWFVLLAPLVVLYTIMTGASASAVRACVMSVVYFMATGLRRRPDAVSSLALAGMLIVAADPTQLVDIGFLYSFVTVMGLMALYPLFRAAIPVPWQGDPLSALPLTRSERVWKALGKALVSAVALSVAAWLSSSLLTAYWFERFSVVALLANILVIPLAFLMVLCGCLSIVLGSCVDLLGELFNHAGVVLIQLFTALIGSLAHIPYASIDVPRPPLWAVFTYYLAATTLTAWLWSRRQSVPSLETEWQKDEQRQESKGW